MFYKKLLSPPKYKNTWYDPRCDYDAEKRDKNKSRAHNYLTIARVQAQLGIHSIMMHTNLLTEN